MYWKFLLNLNFIEQFDFFEEFDDFGGINLSEKCVFWRPAEQQTVHGTKKIHDMLVWGSNAAGEAVLLLLWEVHTGYTMCKPLPWILPPCPAVASSWWPRAKEKEVWDTFLQGF